MREVIRITDENREQYRDIIDIAVTASSVTDNLMVVARGECNKKQDVKPFAMIEDISLYAVHNVDTALLYKSKITDEEIEIALRNTAEDARICDMAKVMAHGLPSPELFTRIDEWEPGDNENPLYILTNSNMQNGAGLIFCDDVLHRIWEKIGNYFLLPSSIHELTICPDSGALQKDDFDFMVKSANSEAVSSEEKLSDRSFYYDGKLN